MCGRYASFRQAQQIADEFDVVALSQPALAIEASWNIPPTANVRIIVERPAAALTRLEGMTFPSSAGAPEQGAEDESVRAMLSARWGLVPPWADSVAIGARMINARSETVATKRSFAKPFATSRCVVVADGYYEWHTDASGAKTPYYIHAEEGASLALAGLFGWWRDRRAGEGAPWVLTTTILTAPARDGLEEIHDREPVMLEQSHLAAWLDPAATDPDDALAIIAAPGPPLQWHPVSPAVGNVRHDSPELIRPAAPPSAGLPL